MRNIVIFALVVMLCFGVSEAQTKPKKNKKAKEVKVVEEPKVEKKIYDLTVQQVFYYEKTEDVKLTEEMRPYLEQLAEYMKNNADVKIKIVAHADPGDAADQAQQRSEDRAAAIAAYLADRGISRGRIFEVGQAARRPVAPNTPEGNMKNRRVEISVVK